jgi:RND family efflux transporter MFP subunit
MARKLVEDFANVAAKQAVLVVQDTSTMEVQVDLPERDVVLMPVELSYEQMDRQAKPVVTLSALPGREYPARVSEFAKAADPVTRTFSVKLVFQTPDDVTLLPGMTARVRVLVDPSSAWTLPVSAVQSDSGGEPFVWLVDEDSLTVSRAVVQVGQMTGDSIRVEEGLEAGQMVAISGVTYLREGMEVRLLER